VAISSVLIQYTTHSLTSIELKGKTEDRRLSEYLHKDGRGMMEIESNKLGEEFLHEN
jgi:hypothetical protein